MGIGPAYAIPKVLKMTGLTLDQIDVIELNEAFAVQSLAVIQETGPRPGARQSSTAAPLPSAIRSAAPEQSSRHPSCANSNAATPATAWSPCASAEAWARPGYSSASRKPPSPRLLTQRTQRAQRGRKALRTQRALRAQRAQGPQRRHKTKGQESRRLPSA